LAIPANPTDAHRPLDKACNPEAILGVVEMRQVANDYTVRFQSTIYRIARADVRTGLRDGQVRIEVRLDGTVHARFQEKYLAIEEYLSQPKQHPLARAKSVVGPQPAQPNEAARQSISGISRRGGMPVWKAARIDKTRGGSSE